MATHSIKITIVKKWRQHYVGAVLPEQFGAYPDDTLIWNIEGAQGIDRVNVKIGGFTQVEPTQVEPKKPASRHPFTSDPRPALVEATRQGRGEISATLKGSTDAEAGNYYGRYKYTIFINDQPALDPGGDFCPDPPCPSF